LWHFAKEESWTHLIGRVVIQGIYEEKFMRMCLELIRVQTVLFSNFGLKHSGVAVLALYAKHDGEGGWGGWWRYSYSVASIHS
jgi:hypothetical protein